MLFGGETPRASISSAICVALAPGPTLPPKTQWTAVDGNLSRLHVLSTASILQQPVLVDDDRHSLPYNISIYLSSTCITAGKTTDGRVRPIVCLYVERPKFETRRESRKRESVAGGGFVRLVVEASADGMRVLGATACCR